MSHIDEGNTKSLNVGHIVEVYRNRFTGNNWSIGRGQAVYAVEQYVANSHGKGEGKYDLKIGSAAAFNGRCRRQQVDVERAGSAVRFA